LDITLLSIINSAYSQQLYRWDDH